MKVEIAVTGKHPDSGDAIQMVTTTASLNVVPPAESQAVERDTYVAERIARLWESTVGLEAMRRNERGDFAGAQHVLLDQGSYLQAFAADTACEDAVRENIQTASHKVGRQWDGRSKREAMMAAKKFSKGERDHRKDPRGKWSDHL
jgi:hypothetical protein